MSETVKHTPGEWRVREVVKFHADDQNTTLEALEIWSGDNLVCEDVDTEEHARLIAAAPDLLAAAKWAESAIAPFSKEPDERSGISRLRAAIAKAGG